MGILGGMWDQASGLVKIATAPVVGVAKAGFHSLETAGKVGLDVLTLDPKKALDDMGNGIKSEANDIVGIPKQAWHGVKGAVGGLGETVVGGAKFVGEPIRGVARVGCNDLATIGKTGGDACEGNFKEAGGDLVGGVGKNFSIAGETAVNEFHNLF